MSFFMGIRKREWSQMVLYSLFFTSISYFILIKLSPIILGFFGAQRNGFQHFINILSHLGGDKVELPFNGAIILSISASPVALICGYCIGRIRISRKFKSFILKHTNRSQNSYIWDDFVELLNQGGVTVLLNNGNAYVGSVVMVSDSSVGSDRGLILRNPVYIEQPLKAAIESRQPTVLSVSGDILIMGDQIATVTANNGLSFASSARQTRILP